MIAVSMAREILNCVFLSKIKIKKILNGVILSLSKFKSLESVSSLNTSESLITKLRTLWMNLFGVWLGLELAQIL